MKKKRGSASERVSAMLLGGAICSKESGKYPGPLFARKRTNYLGRFFFFMVLAVAVIGFWERGRKKVVMFAESIWKNNDKSERALAIEGAAEDVEVEVSPEEERKKYYRNER